MPRPTLAASDTVPTPLELYLREINRTPLLSFADEQELARRIRSGDPEARDQMVRANLRLVVNIAQSYVVRGLSLQDLIEEGNLGLLRAVETFDPDMNTRFSTYAAYWIRQSIKRGLVNSGRLIRVPIYVAKLQAKWRRVFIRLYNELGRPPADEEVAAVLKLSKRSLAALRDAFRLECPPSSLSLFDGRTPGDGIGSSDVAGRPSSRESLEPIDIASVLHVLDQLDQREATVLRLRFGLDGRTPATLQAIGRRLNLTRERVRQIEKSALRRIAALLGESGASQTMTR